jgi:hypothetical protein
MLHVVIPVQVSDTTMLLWKATAGYKVAQIKNLRLRKGGGYLLTHPWQKLKTAG